NISRATKRLRQRMISRLLFPLSCAAPHVVENGLVGTHAHDHHAVEGGVGLAMPAAVQPVSAGLPLKAGTGQAPQSLAKAASERVRSGSSSTRISISGAHRSVSRPRWAS
ncbi:hypothetical protein, partial [Belnapia rosea]|uniref:hypothetical protein n=1 Tax=Belnapia rosea TaxID=938405 RepID=UPI001C40AD42